MNDDNINVKRQVHMANERTFLAWISTSLGIIAFGFVIEKFALFVKQMTLLLGKDATGSLSSNGASTAAGIFLVAFGTLMSLLSYVKYKDVEKQITENIWRKSSVLDLLLTLVVFTAGVFLVFYLIQNSVLGAH